MSIEKDIKTLEQDVSRLKEKLRTRCIPLSQVDMQDGFGICLFAAIFLPIISFVFTQIRAVSCLMFTKRKKALLAKQYPLSDNPLVFDYISYILDVNDKV